MTAAPNSGMTVGDDTSPKFWDDSVGKQFWDYNIAKTHDAFVK